MADVPEIHMVTGHGINPYRACPECGSTEHLSLENYDEMWRDGDIFCMNRQAHESKDKVFVRFYDAG